MTRNSKRRAAEQAVIDAAVKFLPYRNDWTMEPLPTGLLLDLTDRVKELEALGMELPGEARSSTRHPVTSDQAAAWMRGARAKSAAARIVALIYRSFSGTRTVDELMRDLNMPHQTCSARVNELRNDGWLIDTGHKRDTRSGQPAIAWGLSSRADTLIREVGGPEL